MTYGEKRLCEKKWHHLTKLPHAPEWDDFEKFMEWCELSGYEKGKVLKRASASKPFAPGNCYWMNRDKNAKSQDELIAEDAMKWNKTVNVFRKHYGLPLFEE